MKPEEPSSQSLTNWQIILGGLLVIIVFSLWAAWFDTAWSAFRNFWRFFS